MDDRTEARGRPRIGDPDTISDIALGLMTTHGWSSTTMQRIANEAGLSAPTLFRYFPTKADILWHGLDANADMFSKAFRIRMAGHRLADAVADSYLEMLLVNPSRLRIVKKRIAILARDSEASDASWAKFQEWNQLVTGMVAEARQESAEVLPVRIIGAMLWSALWASLLAWSVSGDDDPTTYVRVARRYMDIPEQ